MSDELVAWDSLSDEALYFVDVLSDRIAQAIDEAGGLTPDIMERFGIEPLCELVEVTNG